MLRYLKIKRFFEGSVLLKYHLPPHHNFPLHRKVNAESFRSLVISNKYTPLSSSLQLCPLLKRDIRICKASENAKVAYLNLFPSKHLLRSFTPQCTVWTPVLDINCSNTSLSPQKERKTLVMQHVSSYSYYRSILPLYNLILLWSVSNCQLPLHPLLFSILIELLGGILTPIV